MRIAVSSVCDRSYSPGFHKMARSLRRHASKPFELIQISPDGYKNAVADEMILATSFQGLGKGTRYRHTMNILQAFSLPYDLVVCVDSDMVFLNDPCDSWRGDHGISLCLDDDGLGPRCHGTIERVNSGYMVVDPSAIDHRLLSEIARSGKSYDGGDQGVINLYLEAVGDYEILPIQYNLIKRWLDRKPQKLWAMIRDNEAIGLHFVGRKPWQPGGDPKYKALEKIWHEQ